MIYKQLVLAAALASIVAPVFAAPEKYKIDPTHTYPSIEFSHRAISVWRGKFDKTSGSITLDRATKTGSVDVVIDTASINFGLAAMDEKARSDDYFNVAKFPTATYQGTIKFIGDKPTTVDGQITIMGVTRPVQLNLNLFNCVVHPVLKKELCGANAEGELNWREFGMKSEYAKGDAEAEKVHLRIQVEAYKQE